MARESATRRSDEQGWHSSHGPGWWRAHSLSRSSCRLVEEGAVAFVADGRRAGAALVGPRVVLTGWVGRVGHGGAVIGCAETDRRGPRHVLADEAEVLVADLGAVATTAPAD